MAAFICDPYAPDICLPYENFDIVISYTARSKKQRKHLKWLDSKLTMMGVPLIAADDDDTPDVILKRKAGINRMNRKVFKALRKSDYDGQIFINDSSTGLDLCQAIADNGSSLFVSGDASWYTAPTEI